MKAVRVVQSVRSNVDHATLVKVPFDIDRWREVAKETDPLPEPWSDDPTQWLFEGRPERSTSPLQVAVARLVGYRWPEQPESDDLDVFADADGIVCLPAVAGEPPAADRVQQLLAAAFGESWTPAKVKELLEQAGSKKNKCLCYKTRLRDSPGERTHGRHRLSQCWISHFVSPSPLAAAQSAQGADCLGRPPVPGLRSASATSGEPRLKRKGPSTSPGLVFDQYFVNLSDLHNAVRVEAWFHFKNCGKVRG